MIKAMFGEKSEIVPAGNHVATLYSLIHIGAVEEEYMGDTKLVDKVMLRFELPDEEREFNGEKKPMAISREYTLSFGEKANLRKLVEGMLGTSIEEVEEGYGLEPLLGKSCLLNVIHKTSRQGKEYAFISGAAPLPKKMTAPKQVNPSFIWDFEDKFNEDELEKMPDFLKDKIKSSKQYKAKKGIMDTPDINPDDIPF
jgi:hypothetical protein